MISRQMKVQNASRMSVGARFLVAIGALLLLVLFVLPAWSITLLAPQYPEGLGMRIYIDRIVGATPTDLANINGLNHYIGMKAIEPDAIRDFRIIPWVVGGLAALGVAVALTGRRLLIWGWLGLFAIASAGGVVDFWRWSYDYGHNIDREHAIIKIPEMTYQPPLIGTKQLLNFTASSWPASGTWVVTFAVVLVLAALLMSRPRPQTR